MEPTKHRRNAVDGGVLDALFAGHPRQMGDLDRGGEQRHIETACRQAPRGFIQRRDVLRQVPLVDPHGGDVGAPLAQAV